MMAFGNYRILGIDPGVRGGLALVEFNDGAAPQLVEAIDIPLPGEHDIRIIKALYASTKGQ
jgi:hypothetical protein